MSLSYLLLLSLVLAYAAAEIPRACSTPETDKFPFCNNKIPIDERVRDLISRLQLDEKPPLLTARMSPRGNVSRIGLPEYDWGANCVHGVQSRCGTRCPTSFPSPNALGATWDMSIVKKMGAVIGIELRSLWLQGVGENHANDLPHLGLDCWSPNINIARDPRWGRNQEVPGEDPYLSGQYGIAYTVGLQQGQDSRYLQAVVTLKHWDAYSLENWKGVSRHTFNAIVSTYDFLNTYFPAFKASVIDGGAKGVMCAYNSVNGVPSCASQFLNKTLRGDWGFDGYVTSDSGAVYDIYGEHHYVTTPEEAAAVAIKAGTDINSGGVYISSLIQALQKRLVTEADIDLALFHSLKLRFELGLFDPIEDQPYWHVPPTAVNTPESQALNLLASRESLVLLKNNQNILPFSRGKKIAVVGPHANATSNLVGNYLGQICPNGGFECITSPFLAIQQRNTGGSTVFVEGCSVSGTSKTGFAEAISAAKDADYVVLGLGLDQGVESEGHDRLTITLPGVQDDFSREIIALGKPTVVFLLNGGIIAIEWLKDNAPAIIEAFYPGYQGGNAIADAIFGDYNPGGKLPFTVYNASYVNEVDMLDMNMSKPPGRTYKYFTGTPLWPFGYGLSYTEFKLEFNTTTNPVTISNTKEEAATYNVKVTNVGKYAGDEVVQAYFKPSNDPLIIKQLFGFKRVHLNPGQSITVEFPVTYKTFQLGDHNGNIMSYPGIYGLSFTNGVDQTLNTYLTVHGPKRILESVL